MYMSFIICCINVYLGDHKQLQSQNTTVNTDTDTDTENSLFRHN